MVQIWELPFPYICLQNTKSEKSRICAAVRGDGQEQPNIFSKPYYSLVPKSSLTIEVKDECIDWEKSLLKGLELVTAELLSRVRAKEAK